MLRHTGQNRSFSHNLRLAVLLCLNAGFINAAGFLCFRLLTTNVTGHAAALAINIAENELRSAAVVALWLLLFLAGAFFSGLCIARIGTQRAFVYTIPFLIIIALILMVAIAAPHYQSSTHVEVFAGSLLFAMGMQNALVSMVSGSVVRTTHLTGMFTDLGIDLSTACMLPAERNATLKRKIILRLAIIVSFLAGGVIGGIAFLRISYSAFYIPAGLLLFTLFYDYFPVRIKRAIGDGE